MVLVLEAENIIFNLMEKRQPFHKTFEKGQKNVFTQLYYHNKGQSMVQLERKRKDVILAHNSAYI